MRCTFRLTAMAMGLSALMAGAPANAELLIGLTTTNQLVTFDSSTPGFASLPSFISGLAANESILGIDVRPSSGVLFGLGSMNNIYSLDALTGAATLVAALTANPTDTTSPFSGLIGRSFGVDFNPVPDLGQTLPSLRVTSNTGQNLRINVNSAGAGQTFTDTDLSVTPGTPTIVGSAYTNNDRDAATATALYGIDSANDALYLQTNPNAGTLQFVGNLGVDTSGVVGFDIAGSGKAFASLTDELSGKSSLYDINLTTGSATLIGRFGIGGNSVIAAPLLDIAAAPVPEPQSYAMLLTGLLGIGFMARRRVR